jgi:hypothetical protein
MGSFLPFYLNSCKSYSLTFFLPTKITPPELLLGSKAMAVKTIEGGYTFVKAESIGALLSALKRGDISYRSARIWLACLAMYAARFAARSSSSNKKKKFVSYYTLEEIHAKVGGVGGEYLRADLAALERNKLIEFSSENITILSGIEEEEIISSINRFRDKNRYVPIPRRMLDYLASCSRPTLMKTIMVIILRGLSFAKDGSIKTLGTIKASLIASATGISLRSVRTARKALIDMGFISPDTNSIQRKLNKTGAYFAINTNWSPFTPFKATPLAQEQATTTLKDQNLVNSSSGVLADNSEADIETPPTIKNILKEDLFDFPRLHELYKQALIQKWLLHSESMVLNWISAAVHARSAKDGDPVRIFVTIVKKKLWHHITNHDEDIARAALNRFRDGDPSFYRNSSSQKTSRLPSLGGFVNSLFKAIQ